MATPKEALLGTLKDLGAEDFKEFKWYLQHSEVLDNFPAIRKSALEDADRVDTVDQMVQTYCINTIKVTKMVLEKMNQNNLAMNFSEITTEPTGRSLKRDLTKKMLQNTQWCITIT